MRSNYFIPLFTCAFITACNTKDSAQSNNEQISNEMESVDSMLVRDKKRLDSMQRELLK